MVYIETRILRNTRSKSFEVLGDIDDANERGEFRLWPSQDMMSATFNPPAYYVPNAKADI